HLLSDAEASATKPTQTRNYRLWEIAGSAHSDFWIGYHQEVGMGPRFLGAPKQPASADEDLHLVAGNYGEQPHPMHAACILAGAAFPMRYSVSAALEHLERWVKRRVPPPKGPRFQLDGDTLARDEFGNALGGIRLPPVDVPVASYESDACVLGGYTVPFTEVQLLQLYPTHADYYLPMVLRTRAALRAGYLLPEDARDLLARACAAKSRWLETASSCTFS
ncbi:MAG: alpha/beta hydrolase domain-containing protein, partial [Actinomycetota bacterium]